MHLSESAVVKELDFKQSAARDLVQRVFAGKAGSLVAHLLKNEKVSRDEIDEIRKLIDQESKPRKSESK